MESTVQSAPILVTGASGYVASHCVKQLLEAGYRVRGTVRSLKNPKKVDFLYKLVPEKKDNLELVEADLLLPETWVEATKGVEYVLHVASPFIMGNPREDLLIKPAVEGTLNVLEAALKNGVKKVVITSSVASVWYGNWDKKMVNEDDWSIESACGSYEKSKVRAERAAWDFWRKHVGKIEIATICPGLMVGPVFAMMGGASEEIVTDLMLNRVPGLPKLAFGLVDVRDVALAHIKAMESPTSNGQRYLLVGGTYWFIDIANVLREEFEKHGYKIPKTVFNRCLIKFAANFDKKIKSIVNVLGKEMRVDNSKSIKELGINYRDPKQALIDMGWSFINLGGIPDKRKKK